MPSSLPPAFRPADPTWSPPSFFCPVLELTRATIVHITFARVLQAKPPVQTGIPHSVELKNRGARTVHSRSVIHQLLSARLETKSPRYCINHRSLPAHLRIGLLPLHSLPPTLAFSLHLISSPCCSIMRYLRKADFFVTRVPMILEGQRSLVPRSSYLRRSPQRTLISRKQSSLGTSYAI